MRYLGGKTRNAKWIAAEISARRNGRLYIEPFCGGLSVAIAVKHGPMLLRDAHPGLIALYSGLIDGTFVMPNARCTIEEYRELAKKHDASDPYHTMVGFGMSYAGKWWGGYDTYYDRRGKDGATWDMLVSSLRKKMGCMPSDAVFECGDYSDINPVNSIIYCDPPYANTTEYAFSKKFDIDRFWDKAREWSASNTVLVSEYSAPDDFTCISCSRYNIQMCASQHSVIEKLFVLK